VPYQLTGKNVYDMRAQCEHVPLCYDFSHVDAFFNDADIQKQLGLPAGSSWAECNFIVNKMFTVDFMKNFHEVIPEMLEDGLDVLVYAGDVDYICNWLGNKAWTLKLDWSGKEGFNAAEDKAMTVGGGGRLRSHKNFHFMQVYQAGHMVPMDQPEAAIDMLSSFLDGKLGERGESMPQTPSLDISHEELLKQEEAEKEAGPVELQSEELKENLFKKLKGDPSQNDKCHKAHKDQGSCKGDSNNDCVWCACAAVPSSCWTRENAKALPPGVFSCDFAEKNDENIIA